MADNTQGDFRTGKRLNMKKIIPYIASEFRKDKIWLRRTKPNQRKYQVSTYIGRLGGQGGLASNERRELVVRSARSIK
jgi:midasin